MDEKTFINSNLYYAAERGRLDIAREFLDKGANPDYAELGRTTLTAAVIGDHVEVARLLLERGADPNVKSQDGLTPLMQAKSSNMVNLLAEYNADPAVCDGNRKNALCYFIEWDCLDAVRAWLQLGWPVIRKTKKLTDRLLTKRKFDMISLLTGFEFRAAEPMARIAEFKVRWA